jgi:hypothetical protein
MKTSSLITQKLKWIYGIAFATSIGLANGFISPRYIHFSITDTKPSFKSPLHLRGLTIVQQPIFKSCSKSKLFHSYFEDEEEEEPVYARVRKPMGRRRNNIEPEDEPSQEWNSAKTKSRPEEEEEFEFEDEEFDLDYQGIIPNPILDNIDPEGSAERVGELFSDRQFWWDIGLLLLFLNFLDNLRDPAIFDAMDMVNL